MNGALNSIKLCMAIPSISVQTKGPIFRTICYFSKRKFETNLATKGKKTQQFVYSLLFIADRRLCFAADNASLETILNVTNVFHNKSHFQCYLAAEGV